MLRHRVGSFLRTAWQHVYCGNPNDPSSSPREEPVPRGPRLKLILLGALALVLSSCSLGVQDGVLDSFDAQGPIAEDLANLYWLVFWIAAVIFVLVQGGLAYTMIRFRAKKDDDGVEPKQVEGNPVLEVIWTVIPVVILAAVAVPTVEGVFKYTECAPDSMPVDVIGHQWWFEYYYPEHDIWTANELVIPAGQEICLTMTSEDVLHNFWAPKLNGKRYLIPGEDTTLLLETFELDEGAVSEEFWVHCAEFCGLSHARMRARVIALDDTGFEQWVADQKEPAVAPSGGLEAEGMQLFSDKGCSACHLIREGADGSDNEVLIGPELTHFASRNAFAGATLELDNEGDLAKWLADPPTWKPGSFMPNLGLTETEIEALEAYLRSLK